MNNNKKTKKVLITLSVIFIIILAADIFWFSFIKKEADKVLEFKKMAQKEAVQNYNLTEIKRSISELEQKEEALDNIFIDGDNIVIFIELIENMAAQSGVLTQIQIDNDKGESVYPRLNVVLQANGSWSGVTTFLKMVENLPHNVLIDAAKLNVKNAEDGFSWQLDVSLKISSN